VHIQSSRSFRDIAVTHFIHTLDMLPPHPVRRHRIFGRLHLVSPASHERCIDLVRICRFGKIVFCAQFDGIDRSRDVSLAGQNDYARIVLALTDRRDNVEPISVSKSKVDDCIVGRSGPRFSRSFRNGFGRFNVKPSGFHSARKAPQKRPIVIDNQKRFVRANLIFCTSLRGDSFLDTVCHGFPAFPFIKFLMAPQGIKHNLFLHFT
jgi:hypothetical protein